MSPLPERLSSPWWQRPGRRPGREQYLAGCAGHTATDPWIPHVSVAYSSGTGSAAPVVEALGTRLPEAEVTMRAVSLVAQTQVGRSWQWRPVAEVPFAGH